MSFYAPTIAPFVLKTVADRWVDLPPGSTPIGNHYSRDIAGVTAAWNIGAGNIYVPYDSINPTILWDNSSLLYAGNNLHVYLADNMTFLMPNNAAAASIFNFQTTGGSTTTPANLAVQMNEGSNVVSVGVGPLAAMGIAVGDIVLISQNPFDPADPDSDSYAPKIYSINPGLGTFVVTVPAPYTFTLARAAFTIKLLSGVNNGVNGGIVRGNGNTNVGTFFVSANYQDGFECKDIRGFDMPSTVVYQSTYSYNSDYQNLEAERCGSTSGLMPFEFVRMTAGNIFNVQTDGGLWGIDTRSAVAVTMTNRRANGMDKRGVKDHHARYCVMNGIIGNDSQLNTGYALTGAAKKNTINGVLTSGNYETGFITTQIPGGTNLVEQNEIQGVGGTGNGAGLSNCDVMISGNDNKVRGNYTAVRCDDLGLRNTFFDVEMLKQTQGFFLQNSAAETSLISLTAPIVRGGMLGNSPGASNVNRIIQIRCKFAVVNNVSAAENFRLRLKYGGVLLYDSFTIALPQSANARECELLADIGLANDNGHVYIAGYLGIGNITLAAVGNGNLSPSLLESDFGNGSVAVNTLVDQTIDATIQLSVANNNLLVIGRNQLVEYQSR